MFPAILCDMFLQAEEGLSYAELLAAITQGWLLPKKPLQLMKILNLLFMILLQGRGTTDDHFLIRSLRPYQELCVASCPGFPKKTWKGLSMRLYQELYCILLFYAMEPLFRLAYKNSMTVQIGNSRKRMQIFIIVTLST